MKQGFLITRAPRRVATLALVLLLALTALGAWPSHGFSLAASVASDPNLPQPLELRRYRQPHTVGQPDL